MKMQWMVLALAISGGAYGQSTVSSPMHGQQQESSEQHSASVDTRGDQGMGFSHEKSVHHFQLLADGGAIEVNANDAADEVTRDAIRTHLTHIVAMFSAGNFQVPMFIHDNVPPGVPVMKSKGASIFYTFEATPAGGRVRIKTADLEALQAIHLFLAFQIEDHRTGDSGNVRPPA